MWRRKVANIKTVRVATESWERVTTEHTFCVSGNVSVFSWIIKLDIRVTSSSKTLLMHLQYFWSLVSMENLHLNHGTIVKIAACFEATCHGGILSFTFHFFSAEQLIDEIPICLKTSLLCLPFYYFRPFLSIKSCENVDSIACFFCNSRKCELSIILESWKSWDAKINLE